MRQYEHGGDIYGNHGVELDFSVNTNPFGIPPEVLAALTSRAEEFARYPDTECRELRSAIARHENVPKEWVLCGNGAADLIYRLCYAVKPRRAFIPAPAFSEYERALSRVGCAVERYSSDEMNLKFSPDTDMMFICNPNNPTGRLIPENLLEKALTEARVNGTVTVVDECFLDFTNGTSAKMYLENMPQLVILKAFTKTYAMAGLRLGYLLTANENLLSKTKAAAQCWSVSVPAQIAGVAALECTDWVRKTRRFVADEREYLSEKLKKLGVTVFPSDANFLLIRYETPRGAPLYEVLLQRGILIRSCENFEALDKSYCRIAVKTRKENDRLIKAVGEIIV